MSRTSCQPEGPDLHLAEGARSQTAFIALAGNIGSGKTTVATLLSRRLGLDLRLESVDDNPYLERFYGDMPTWVFPLNMYFLGSRSQQILDAATGPKISVFDRSLYEDKLFVDLALADGVTTADNYATFCRLYEVLIATLPRPALLVYLGASVDQLGSRIRSRGRAYEDRLGEEALTRLQARYDEWIDAYDLSPVLRVDTVSSDLRHDESALTSIVRQVAEILRL